MTGWRSSKYSRSPQGIYHNQGRVQKNNVKREKMSFRRCDTPSSGHKFAKHQGTHYTFADGSCFNNGKPNARAGYVLFVNVCCCRSLSIYFVHLSLSFQKKMLSSCFFFVRFHAFFGPNDARNTIARFSGVQSNNRAHVCALQYIMQVRLGACSTVQKKKQCTHDVMCVGLTE